MQIWVEYKSAKDGTTTRLEAPGSGAIAHAKKEREAAMQAMNTAQKYTRAWREAEENLNFWQGKLANLEAFANK
jgi:hypothetical protein